MQTLAAIRRIVSWSTENLRSRAPKGFVSLALTSSSFLSGAFAQVSAPVFSPAEGTSPVKIPVVITCTTAGATVHYTTDGQTPTQSDDSIVLSGTPASGTLDIYRTLTLKAKAFNGSGQSSSVTTGSFAITGMVSAGSFHSLAIRFDGAIYAWGDQTDGGLGNGVTTSGTISTPGNVLIASGTSFTTAAHVSAGEAHTLVIDQNSNLWAFGTNGYGQLGDGSQTNRSYPVRVESGTAAGVYLTGIAQAEAAEGFSVALTTTGGTVKAWGVGVGGRLGNGASTNQSTPVNVKKDQLGGPVLDGMSEITIGRNFAGALEASTGKVWMWGRNGTGQLGLGNSADKDRANKVQIRTGPFTLADLNGVIAISAGEDHTLALRNTGTENRTVWAWGEQQYGTLGNGTTADATVDLPVKVQKQGGGYIDNITQIDAGAHVSLALASDGKVWSWGRNNTGALGDGGTTDRGVADTVKLSGTTPLSNIVWVSAGGSVDVGFCLALAADGTLYSWGYNGNGALGDGTATNRSNPVVSGTNVWILNKPPTGSLSVSGTLFTPPATVTLTATASDPEGAVSRVRFFQGSTLIATDTTSPYSFQVNSLGSGTYAYTAVIQDNAGATFNTGTSTVVVSGQPALSVSSVPATIAENSGTNAVFRIAATPTGTSAITLGFALSGSAVNGTDYQTISNFTATIASGSSSVDVPISPLADGIYEGNENVVFTILSGTGYVVGSGSSATLTITQSQPGLISKNGGDGQVGAPGAYLAQPLSVLVLSGSGGTAQQNAPVLFTITSGSGGLAAASGDSSTTSSLTVYTGTNGIANVFYKQSLAGAAASTITAQSGTIAGILTFTSTTTDPYGPIARWKFDEGSGVIAAEATGLGVSGTLTGGTTWTTGFDGDDAVAFSGTSQYVTMGAPAGEVLDFDTESFSIGFWIKYSSIASTARVLGKGYDNSGPGYGIWLTSDGKLKAAIGTTNSGTAASATLAFGTQSAFNDNEWHHVTVSFDRTAATARIYVDGIVQKLVIVAGTGGSVGPSDATVVAYPALTELNAAKTNKAFTVGSKDGTADFLTGAVDDIRFYSRALNLTEATGLFNVDSDGDGMPDAWEQKYLGGVGASPIGNADGDGALNNVDARPNDNSVGQMGINITTPANGSNH
jgi:alpha-tubulin suppressor-like RCC1 family protein